MRLIWHIVKKDIARERWALALWSLLFLMQIGLGVFLRHNDGLDADLISNGQTFNSVLVFLEFATAYILVARLVQADALTGSSMFWLTRPISGARLLAAKILGALLLFGVLPILLLLPWWIYCSFGLRDILWVALEVFGWQVLVIAAAFLVASLADDLGRVLLWTLLLGMALFGWMVLWQSLFVTRLIGAEGVAVPGVIYTRVLLGALILIVGSASLGVHQFVTRRLVRSMILAVGCMGLIALIGQTWRWDWSQSLLRWQQLPHAFDAGSSVTKNVTLAMERADVSSIDRRKKKETAMVRLSWQVRGVPEELVVGFTDVIQTWTWPDGPVFTRQRGSFSQRFPADGLRKMLSMPKVPEDPETSRWYQEKRDRMNERLAVSAREVSFHSVPDLHSEMAGVVPLTSYAPFPLSVLARVQAQPPAFAATVKGMLTRPKIMAEWPLKESESRSGEALTFRLVRVQHAAETAEVQVVTTEPSIARHGLWAARLMKVRMVSSPPGRFVTVNREEGSYQLIPGNVLTRTAWVGGVIVGWSTISIIPDKVVRGEKWVVRDAEWFGHTALVVYTHEAVAAFTQEVKVDKFELAPLGEERPAFQ